MKTTVLLLCMALFTIYTEATPIAKTVNISTAGTLRTFFNPVEKSNTSSLIVTGNIDARDFKYMRDSLSALAVVDLSSVSIQAYNGTGGTMSGSVSYGVNEFPANAFMSKSTLTSIVFPTGITSIGAYSLMSCTGLTGTITIPNSVVSIGDFAFQICINISGLVLGNSVKNINMYAFASCNNLSGVINIPNSTISIGQAAFQYCSLVTEINMGTSIVSFGQYPFLGCSGLTKISIANQIPPIIPSNTFQGVTLNTFSLVVPSSSVSAYQTAAYWNGFLSIVGGAPATQTKTIDVATAGTLSALLAATEKSTITNLTVTGKIDARDVKFMRDEMSLLSVLDLSEVNIQAYSGIAGTNLDITSYPANEMPAYSFFNQKSIPTISKQSLTTVKMPGSITAIGDYAFFQCTGLTGTLTIPENVITIGSSVYQDCSGLSGILIIPDKVTTIGDCAFGWCSGFTELILGKMVSAIGSEGFTDCGGLTKVSVPRLTPPVIVQNTFGFNKSNCTLYVPIGASSAYRNADYWKDFLLISEKNFPTETMNIHHNHFYAYSSNSSIIIEGINKGETVSIYSLNGKLLINMKSQGEKLTIPMTLSGIYLIKTTTECLKVRL